LAYPGLSIFVIGDKRAIELVADDQAEAVDLPMAFLFSISSISQWQE